MKKTAFLGTLIAGIMILVLMVVPGASASSGFAPSFQDETPTAEEEATEEVVEETTPEATEEVVEETTPEATEEVVEETTSETTDDTTTDDTPAALPETGGNSGLSTLLLGFAALIIMGIAAAMIASSRRRTQI